MEHSGRYMVIRCDGASSHFFPSYLSFRHPLILARIQLISLIYGANFNIFRPKNMDRDHEEYVLGVVMEQFRYFGPFPAKIQEVCSAETVQSILYIMQEIPQSKMTPFSRTTEREVRRKDNEFISKMMKMDWRDRPTAKELLQDVWWENESP